MMVHKVIQSALDLGLLFDILLLLAWILDHKFMKGAVFGDRPEDGLLTMEHSDQIVKFHQKTLMRHRKDPQLFVLLLVEEMLFDELLEEGEAASVDVAPTFTFLAFVHSHIESFLVGVFFPGVKGLPFENASASLADEWGEDGLDLLQMLSSAFAVVKGSHSSGQIGYIDEIEGALLFGEMHSYSLRLLLP